MGKIFTSYNRVRMHDTDMAGILYFPRQFRFIHDALEDLMEAEGHDFETLFHKEPFVFVVVHAESDYFAPLHVGNKIEVKVSVEAVGNSSFTMQYMIYKKDGMLVGKGKTVHVTLDNKTRTKISIPPSLKTMLYRYASFSPPS